MRRTVTITESCRYEVRIDADTSDEEAEEIAVERFLERGDLFYVATLERTVQAD